MWLTDVLERFSGTTLIKSTIWNSVLLYWWVVCKRVNLFFCIHDFMTVLCAHGATDARCKFGNFTPTVPVKSNLTFLSYFYHTSIVPLSYFYRTSIVLMLGYFLPYCRSPSLGHCFITLTCCALRRIRVVCLPCDINNLTIVKYSGILPLLTWKHGSIAVETEVLGVYIMLIPINHGVDAAAHSIDCRCIFEPYVKDFGHRLGIIVQGV